MVPGLPDPDDPTDELLLVIASDGSQWTYLALARREWAPIVSALRRIPAGGNARGHHDGHP